MEIGARGGTMDGSFRSHARFCFVSFQDENDVNVTTSELSFVPTTEDDGKEITCRAENPSVQGMYMEDKWKIDVVCK